MISHNSASGIFYLQMLCPHFCPHHINLRFYGESEGTHKTRREASSSNCFPPVCAMPKGGLDGYCSLVFVDALRRPFYEIPCSLCFANFRRNSSALLSKLLSGGVCLLSGRRYVWQSAAPPHSHQDHTHRIVSISCTLGCSRIREKGIPDVEIHRRAEGIWESLLHKS